jgi:hypothetical protein
MDAERATGSAGIMRHRVAGGPVVRLDTGSTDQGLPLRATVRTKGWRLCALRGRGWRVPAPTRARQIARTFTKATDRLAVEVARPRRADGWSCANPLVVYPGQVGDIEAGFLDIAEAKEGDAYTRTAHWGPLVGFRTCYAGGLGAAGFGTSTAFVDRRTGDDLTHVVDTYPCCPNHAPGFQYLFAAYRRDGSIRR